jgi:hypothetical protein
MSKKLPLILGLLSVFFFTTVSAGSSYSGRIKRILVGPSFGDNVWVVVQDKVMVIDSATCSTHPTYSYVIDASTTSGKHALTLVTSAYAAGRNVMITGTGSCTLTPANNIENLDSILVRE